MNWFFIAKWTVALVAMTAAYLVGESISDTFEGGWLACGVSAGIFMVVYEIEKPNNIETR